MNEREAAVNLISDILSEGAYNNIVLRRFFGRNKALSAVQRAFITELVNGTLRNMILIDYVLNNFSKTKTSKMKPMILNILRIGVYQIMFMDRVPDSAAVNEAVKMTKKRGMGGLSGFVNGVLRNVSRDAGSIEYPSAKKEYLSVKYSYPEWIIGYWIENFGEEMTEEMCIANSRPPLVSACINTLKTDRTSLKNILAEENITFSDGKFSDNMMYLSNTSDLTELSAFKDGLFHVMDESAAMCVRAADPNRGDTVMDVCAAPGGKSFLCAYLMENEGQIVSRDIYEHKTELIESGAKRLGISIIKTELGSACEIGEEYSEKADIVIVDAPCSGLGLLRKKPDIKYNKEYSDIEALSNTQREILASAAKCVKKGGVLVYSTCTISPEENEKNAEWFAENFDFDFDSLRPYVGEKFADRENLDKGILRIMPQDYSTDGFFIARFKKRV